MQLVVTDLRFEEPEADVGIGPEFLADLVEMRGQDEQRLPDPDQAADHGGRAFHGILYVGALEELVNQDQPFPAVVDPDHGIADALDLVVKITLSLDDIVGDIDVAQDAIEQAQLHGPGRHTHAEVGQEYVEPDGFDEGALARHVGAGEENEIGVVVHADVVGHRVIQQQVIDPFRFQIRLIALHEPWEAEVEGFHCHGHGIPGVELAVDLHQFFRA